MERTQIYLPKQMKKILKYHAVRDGISMSHKIRQILNEYICKTSLRKDVQNGSEVRDVNS